MKKIIVLIITWVLLGVFTSPETKAQVAPDKLTGAIVPQRLMARPGEEFFATITLASLHEEPKMCLIVSANTATAHETWSNTYVYPGNWHPLSSIIDASTRLWDELGESRGVFVAWHGKIYPEAGGRGDHSFKVWDKNVAGQVIKNDTWYPNGWSGLTRFAVDKNDLLTTHCANSSVTYVDLGIHPPSEPIELSADPAAIQEQANSLALENGRVNNLALFGSTPFPDQINMRFPYVEESQAWLEGTKGKVIYWDNRGFGGDIDKIPLDYPKYPEIFSALALENFLIKQTSQTAIRDSYKYSVVLEDVPTSVQIEYLGARKSGNKYFLPVWWNVFPQQLRIKIKPLVSVNEFTLKGYIEMNGRRIRTLAPRTVTFDWRVDYSRLGSLEHKLPSGYVNFPQSSRENSLEPIEIPLLQPEGLEGSSSSPTDQLNSP